jgi:hypothetical protein
MIITIKPCFWCSSETFFGSRSECLLLFNIESFLFLTALVALVMISVAVLALWLSLAFCLLEAFHLILIFNIKMKIVYMCLYMFNVQYKIFIKCSFNYRIHFIRAVVPSFFRTLGMRFLHLRLHLPL